MSKRPQGYIKGEFKKRPFYERHQLKIASAIMLGSAVFIFAPRIRAELTAYYEMQHSIEETRRLVECLAFGDELRNEIAT